MSPPHSHWRHTFTFTQIVALWTSQYKYGTLGISEDLHENVTNNSVSGFLDNKNISVYCILILIHQNDTAPNTVSISLKGTSCVDNCGYNLV